MDWKVETQKPGRLISRLLKPARHETGRVLVSEGMKRGEGGRKGEVCVHLRVGGRHCGNGGDSSQGLCSVPLTHCVRIQVTCRRLGVGRIQQLRGLPSLAGRSKLSFHPSNGAAHNHLHLQFQMIRVLLWPLSTPAHR